MKYHDCYKNILDITVQTTNRASSASERSLIRGGCFLTQNGISFTHKYTYSTHTAILSVQLWTVQHERPLHYDFDGFVNTLMAYLYLSAIRPAQKKVLRTLLLMIIALLPYLVNYFIVGLFEETHPSQIQRSYNWSRTLREDRTRLQKNSIIPLRASYHLGCSVYGHVNSSFYI